MLINTNKSSWLLQAHNFGTDLLTMQCLYCYKLLVYNISSRTEMLTCTLHSNDYINVQLQLPTNKPNCSMNIQWPSSVDIKSPHMNSVSQQCSKV